MDPLGSSLEARHLASLGSAGRHRGAQSGADGVTRLVRSSVRRIMATALRSRTAQAVAGLRCMPPLRLQPRGDRRGGQVPRVRRRLRVRLEDEPRVKRRVGDLMGVGGWRQRSATYAGAQGFEVSRHRTRVHSDPVLQPCLRRPCPARRFTLGSYSKSIPDHLRVLRVRTPRPPCPCLPTPCPAR